jgi:hypothetical protein
MKTSPESKTAYKDDSSTELTAANPSTKDAKTADAKSVKSADAAKSKGNFNLILIVGAVAVILGAVWWLTQKPANSPATNTAVKVNTSNAPVPEQKPPTMTDVPVGGAQTPTEAYRMLFAAVKSQDPAKIKLMLTQGSMGLAQMAAGQQKKTVEEVIKNGFTETTFVDDYPQTRDERIKDKMGAVEVWNAQRKTWEDLPFMFEDGSWKLAIGEAFGGSFKSPGKGQAVLEQENANANNPNAMIQRLPAPNANTNGNFRSGGKVTKPKNQ